MAWETIRYHQENILQKYSNGNEWREKAYHHFDLDQQGSREDKCRCENSSEQIKLIEEQFQRRQHHTHRGLLHHQVSLNNHFTTTGWASRVSSPTTCCTKTIRDSVCASIRGLEWGSILVALDIGAKLSRQLNMECYFQIGNQCRWKSAKGILQPFHQSNFPENEVLEWNSHMWSPNLCYSRRLVWPRFWCRVTWKQKYCSSWYRQAEM